MRNRTFSISYKGGNLPSGEGLFSLLLPSPKEASSEGGIQGMNRYGGYRYS